MYIYTYTYHTHVCMICVYIYICIYVHTYMYIYTYIYIYVHTYIHTYTHTHAHVYIKQTGPSGRRAPQRIRGGPVLLAELARLSIYLSLSLYIYVYIHIYISLSLSIYICIYIYIYGRPSGLSGLGSLRRHLRKGGWYGWKPSSSSKLWIRVVRAYPLIEIRHTVPRWAIRCNSISVNSTLPPLTSATSMRVWCSRQTDGWTEIDGRR